MHHALTGQLLWTVDMPAMQDAKHAGLFDAALLPPLFEISSTASVVAAAPDAIAMDRSGRVFRFSGFNGAPIWLNDIAQPTAETETSAIPIKLHSTQAHTVVISLLPHRSKVKIFSSSETYSLSVSVFSSVDGARLCSYDLPNSQIEMTTDGSTNTADNVLVLGKDGTTTSKLQPQLIWLQSDGTIRSVKLPLPKEQKEMQVEASSVHIIKSKAASRYIGLSELPILSPKGIIVALTNDHKSEALKIKTNKQELQSFWLFEEEAKDAIYAGTIDRRGQPYISRTYFARNQQLLNLHTLWVDAHDGEGQVTGFSFQWDHDLNGDVLAAPFEASQVSEFQLVTRAALVTASSSIRMIQEERHQWIREEGLSHTTASILIDLPESRVASNQHQSGLNAKTLLEGEGYLHRLERHLVALQYAPQYTFDTLWKAILEIPAISLDSFGIQGIGTKQVSSIISDQAKKVPIATTQVKKYGAAPLGGVGAQNVAKNGPMNLPKGVPQVNTRRVKHPKPEESPPPPAALAPRLANQTVASDLKRDAFGFRKLIVATSKKGKIYAVDSQTNEYLWEKSLVGFGEGEGEKIPNVNIRLLALVRSVGGSGVDVGSTMQQQHKVDETLHVDAAQLEYAALIVVVAEVEEKGVMITRLWELEPLTGVFPGGADSQTGLALFPGKAKDAFLLPIEDEKTGQIATAIIDPNNRMFVTPTTPSIVERFANTSRNFYYAIKEEFQGQTILTGYRPTVESGVVNGERVWQLPIVKGEEIISIERPSQDSVASQGKVLGNRKTLYKYLNPHSLVVVTRNVERKSARAFVVDGITGRILHESILCDANLALAHEDGTESKIHVAFTENWASIVFDVDVAGNDELARYKGAHRQTRLISMEMFEIQGNDETWKWQGRSSSFISNAGRAGIYSSTVQVYSQVYVLPSQVRGISFTRTKYGISSKALLVANTRGKIIALPRRILDPRRPVGRKPTKEELEEGLITYEPYIPENPRLYVGGNTVVPMMSRIKTKASLLESTSVVFVYGSLDWWVTKVAPSGTFDLLSGECLILVAYDTDTHCYVCLLRTFIGRDI